MENPCRFIDVPGSRTHYLRATGKPRQPGVMQKPSDGRVKTKTHPSPVCFLILVMVGYPLVMSKQLWKITMINGKIHYKWSFSIAMLNYQRVNPNCCLSHPNVGHLSLITLMFCCSNLSIWLNRIFVRKQSNSYFNPEFPIQQKKHVPSFTWISYIFADSPT